VTNILRIFLLSAAVAVAGTQTASALELSGKFIQGGLVTGKVLPGTGLTLDGKPVAVAPDGSFIIGFGRKAKTKMVLRTEPPEGLPETRELAIEARKYKVQRVDGLPERKVSPTRPEDLARIKTDQVQIAEVRKRTTLKTFFDTGFMWPVEGRISGVFGSQRILNGKPRAPHNGVDIAAPRGTPVKTMGDGVVALINQDMFFTGKTVMIDHGLGLTSVYVHMDTITVKEGDFVTKGMQIGTVGATGRVTGPHLHWGVSWFATHLDPALLVEPQKPRD
jgi:murein DD-endopeptidase MepM/ murein hydrolase activator NlpD